MALKSKFIGIDNVRGLVAIWVMLGHYLLIGHFIQKTDLNLNSVLQYFDPVALFFIISGFLIPMSLKKHGPKIFLKKRFYRIMPVLFTVSSFHFIFVHQNFSTFINTLLLTFDITKNSPQVSVYWSLVIEVYFYLILSLSYHLCNKKITPSIFLAIAASFSLYLLSDLYNNHYYMSVFSRYTSLLIFIFIGSIIYTLEETKNIKNFTLNISLLLILLYFSINYCHKTATDLLFQQKFSDEYPEGVFIISETNEHRLSIKTYFLSKISMIILFFITLRYFNINSKILTFLSKISYPIYLSHLTIYIALQKSFTFQSHIKLGYIASLVTILVSYIIHRYIEKPGIKGSALPSTLTIQNINNKVHH
ncbi:MAG: acyltransferase family protein [Oligoflexales bacterium]